MNDATSPLLTDLYQLNMIQAYLDHGQTETAVFEFFVRTLPSRRQFLMAAGLEQALDFLQDLRFSADDLDWLARSGRFGKGLIDYLAALRFTGDVHAMPEGTVFFADEPILRVTAPLPQAQLVETRLINLLHFQTLIASKAARMRAGGARQAAGRFRPAPRARRGGRPDGGARELHRRLCRHRHGAGRQAVRHSDLRHDGAFVRPVATTTKPRRSKPMRVSRPDNLTLLIDTYDTEAAARKVVALAPRLQGDGHHHRRGAARQRRSRRAVARGARAFSTTAACRRSGYSPAAGSTRTASPRSLRAGAPIDGFGIGTSLTTSSDAPTLDCVYKLAGICRARRAASARPARRPGPAASRSGAGSAPDGRMAGDVLSLESDRQDGEPLLELGHAGRPPRGAVAVARRHAGRARRASSRGCRSRCANSVPQAPYPVEVADALARLAREVDMRLARTARRPERSQSRGLISRKAGRMFGGT